MLAYYYYKLKMAATTLVTSLLSCRRGVSATMTVVQEWHLYQMISHCSFTTALCNLHGAHEQLLFYLLFYLNYMYLIFCLYTGCTLIMSSYRIYLSFKLGREGEILPTAKASMKALCNSSLTVHRGIGREL